MAGIDRQMLSLARRQFCLDIGMDWRRYEKEPNRKVYMQKMTYTPGTRYSAAAGARRYEKGDSFFTAIICMGQLFLGADETIYDWACGQFSDCSPEWFCKYANLRLIDRKLQEYGRCIGDTHVYYLPEADMARAAKQGGREASVEGSALPPGCGIQSFGWYGQEELLQFKENNRFDSAICFSLTQPDMLAVAALKNSAPHAGKALTQDDMAGMAGVSADGEYLWQIGINVDREYTGCGIAACLVRQLAEEVIRQDKVPFYGTSESHTVSQTVACKAGFVPAFTEIYVTAKAE